MLVIFELVLNFVLIIINLTIITDTGGGNLEKVQFARIINGKLMYDSGESDSTVFEGLNTFS